MCVFVCVVPKQLADISVRNMVADRENHCVIISGESGAGKTEASKKIMEYIAAVSSKAADVEKVKQQILESNPLLEAFGNAKTVRNNNSSRFGKYFEIQFSYGGDPVGGKITQYLLEKSRIVSRQDTERSFHIFYQLLAGSSAQEQKELQLYGPEHYAYLSQSNVYRADGIDDRADFAETKTAMTVCGISSAEQKDIMHLLAGILHLGNMSFASEEAKGQDDKAVVDSKEILAIAAQMLGVTGDKLAHALTHRSIKGGSTEVIKSTLGKEQALYSRDSLAKAVYSRLFQWIVERINTTMHTEKPAFVIGVLDIYGFEIFQTNGFEQLCINFVNEKLQQIFIELTLKKEQEEYVKEGIAWTRIDYYDNRPCCELIERNGGILSLLDEECLFPKGTDESFHTKLFKQVTDTTHLTKGAGSIFVIKHFAGVVEYDTKGFLDKNKDTLFSDLVELMMASSLKLGKEIFAADAERMKDSKKRPVTAGTQFKTQVAALMDALRACVPHYIRCIKPNERKVGGYFDDEMVRNQVRYLGLVENVRVRRAGFAFRMVYGHFLHRYKMLTEETWPKWSGDEKSGCEKILQHLKIAKDEYQFGKTKIFIKSPQTVFKLEEMREAKLVAIVSKIQRFYRAFVARKWYLLIRASMQDIFSGQKERRKFSINRKYYGDYGNFKHAPFVVDTMHKNDDSKILFADNCNKINKRYKSQRRSIVVTDKAIYNLSLKTPAKGKIARRIPHEMVTGVSLSELSDNFIIIHATDYDYLLENNRKSELVVCLKEHYRKTNKDLAVKFSNNITYKAKEKDVRTITFTKVEGTPRAIFAGKGKTSTVTVGSDLPKDAQPKSTYVPVEKRSGYRGPAGGAASSSSGYGQAGTPSWAKK
ncbi:myosin IE, variant [Capsaspora owczarzaki ATCC 30864]|uniref:Myosin IE, variant n=1 Tax=Capsaspora owczarzaki (strain ATCC 30864) TaxID=595528 RepID=A0A0D2X5B4_CAPO3|nr:myosin IE, variant [Capsaspora owczarzaki ATCC 30864]